MHKRTAATFASMLIAAGLLSTGSLPVSAETLESALARAYTASPIINSQRAFLRGTDEGVNIALSGFRPRVSATASAAQVWTQTRVPGLPTTTETTNPVSVGVQLNQTIYDGGRTISAVRGAESNVFAGRENLEAQVQSVLFEAARAYMDVLRDTAILNLQRSNIDVLGEQLRQTRDRFDVGEVTRTDVAQAEAREAAARAQVNVAEGNLRASIAIYRQVVGTEPRQLAPGRVPQRLVPGSVEQAIQIALSENPAIAAAMHALDVAQAEVRVAEGALLPTVGLQAGLSHTATGGRSTTDARVTAQLNVPIYQAGEEFARIRQLKHIAAQRRFQIDIERERVRAAVIASWGQFDAATAQIAAAQAQVSAAETALAGVREEARVGQRTTLDVLNAQQELLVARVNLITAQRDRVVAGFSVIQAMGRLTPTRLALATQLYDPSVHFDQVRGLWFGTQTPTGD